MRPLLVLLWLGSGLLCAQVPDTCLRLVPLHLVVLGSSTAAGVGPSDPDSAWVPRYLRSLQTLHTDYRITNLARGGYQTYHLMPDGYQPGPGHPQPDPARNISRALRLQPDAIIVNLPSNDASALVGAKVQMQNFRRMSRLADRAGVPLWVCTPQPRAFERDQVAIQRALLDSIEAAYGDRSIDFWRGFADEEGLPLRRYDAGDGIHLNDAGHRRLQQRLQAAGIPGSRPPATRPPDHRLRWLSQDLFCAQGLGALRLRLINVGQTSEGTLVLRWQQGDSLRIQRHPLTLPACTPLTESLDLDLRGGPWQVKAWVEDSLLGARTDTLRWAGDLHAVPPPRVVGDTVCLDQSAELLARAAPRDQVYWYQRPDAAPVLASGTQLQTPPLRRDTTWWAAVERGPLRRQRTLRTVDRFDRDGHGLMVDLWLRQPLTIDSLRLPLNSRGEQTVRLWTRRGSHRGHETQRAGWKLWDSVQVRVDQGWTWVAPAPRSFLPGDTVALYVQLSDPSRRLRYDATDRPATFDTPELVLVTGSSLSHAFGGVHFPRIANLGLSYHFEGGSCQSRRLPVIARVSPPPPAWAGDTALAVGDTLRLAAPVGYRYRWSTGDSSRAITVAVPAGVDSLEVSLTLTDGQGCIRTDSLRVYVRDSRTGWQGPGGIRWPVKVTVPEPEFFFPLPAHTKSHVPRR